MENLIQSLVAANADLNAYKMRRDRLSEEGRAAEHDLPPEHDDLKKETLANIKVSERKVSDCVAAIVQRFLWDHSDVGEFSNAPMLDNVWSAWCAKHQVPMDEMPDKNITSFISDVHLQDISPIKPPPRAKHVMLDALIGVSTDPSRAALSCVLVHRKGKETRIVSTDGRRLMVFPMNAGDGIPFPYIDGMDEKKKDPEKEVALRLMDHGGDAPDGQWLWSPLSTADSRLLSGLSDSDVWPNVKEAWNYLHCSGELSEDEKVRLEELNRLPYSSLLGLKIIRHFAGRWWSLEIGPVYPNYESVIPEQKSTVFKIDNPVAFLPHITACLKWKKFHSDKAKRGIDFALQYRDDAQPIALNGGLFPELLQSMQGRGKTTMRITDGQTPVVIEAEDGSFAVLMPLRDCNYDQMVFLDRFVSEEERAKFKNYGGPMPVKIKSRKPAKRVGVNPVPAPAPIPAPVVVSKPADVLEGKRKDASAKKLFIKTAIHDGKFTVTDRVIKNLLFQQPMRFKSKIWIESRLDFIHRLLEDGNLAASKYVDKKGKDHWLVNKQFVGQIAYEYATHLLSGGSKIDATTINA